MLHKVALRGEHGAEELAAQSQQELVGSYLPITASDLDVTNVSVLQAVEVTLDDVVRLVEKHRRDVGTFDFF